MDIPKILIVDDEAEIRTSLNNFLSRNIECNILEAGDGKEAMDILKKEVFDLVLLDLKMPGISGMDVLKKTKEIQPQTEIVVISAWDSQAVAREAIKEGAQDYITKPSTINVIFNKVCESLKKKNKYLPKNKEGV